MIDWQAILERDGPAVWRTAFRILGNRADSDDCLQEAFLAALAVSRRGVVQHWRGLLQHLATARAVDRLRERRRRGAPESVADWGAIGGADASPARLAEDVELAEALRAALARLPDRQAEVFCLHCLDGWSYREIADRLSTTTDAVGVTLHRARERLRGLMGPHLDAPTARDSAPHPAAKEAR